MDIAICINICSRNQSGVTGVLDSFAKPQAALFPSTLLWSDYTGDSIKIRRASDDSPAEIPFVDGLLDEAAIASHCGASEGFIVTVYDQSGNGNDWTQSTTTNQPKIYNGSAVNKVNGFAAFIQDGGSGTSSNLASSTGSAATATLFAVYKATTNQSIVMAGTPARYVGYMTSGSGLASCTNAGTPSLYVNGSSIGSTRGDLYTAANGNQVILSVTGLDLEDGTNWDVYNTDDTTNDFIDPANELQGLIVYDTDQSSNRAAIETALNNYLGVY